MASIAYQPILPTVTGDYPEAVQEYAQCQTDCTTILRKHMEATDRLIKSMTGMSPAELKQADRDLVTLNSTFVSEAKALSERTKRAIARIYQ